MGVIEAIVVDACIFRPRERAGRSGKVLHSALPAHRVLHSSLPFTAASGPVFPGRVKSRAYIKEGHQRQGQAPERAEAIQPQDQRS